MIKSLECELNCIQDSFYLHNYRNLKNSMLNKIIQIQEKYLQIVVLTQESVSIQALKGGKIEIIKKVRYKILDFIYYAIFQYSIIYILIAIIFNSNYCLYKIKGGKIVSFILFVIAVQKLNNPKFELNTFTSMKKGLMNMHLSISILRVMIQSRK